MEGGNGQDRFRTTSILVIITLLVISWLVSVVKYRQSYRKLVSFLEIPNRGSPQ
jgi:hypothetical protein